MSMSQTKVLHVPYSGKGGVGKSTTGAVIASTLLASDARLGIVEADAGVVGAIPDLRPRFADRPGVETATMPLHVPYRDTIDTIGDPFQVIADMDVSHVVVNVPGGAPQVLEDVGPILAEAAVEEGMELRIPYVLGGTEASFNDAVSLADGTMFAAASRTVLVRNEANASARDFDRWLDERPKIRDLPRATIGRLSADAVSAFANDYADRNLVELTTPGTTPLATLPRIALQRWFAAASESLQPALLPELTGGEAA
jgi:hypothetical protein